MYRLVLFKARVKSACATVLIVSLTLFRCENDQSELKLQNEINDIKRQLVLANTDNNLITNLDFSDQFYTLRFENGNHLPIRAHLITNIEYDSASWIARFHFRDSTSQHVYFIGRLNLTNDLITLNPYGTSPLSALAEIKTPVNGKFRISVLGKPHGGITVEKTFDYFGNTHVLPILGLYEGYINQVDFVFLNNDNKPRCSQRIAILTESIENKPVFEIEILKNTLSDTYQGLYIITDLKLGFDQKGETRWYYKNDGTSFYTKLMNGNFVVSLPSKKAFAEVTMTGKHVRSYDVPNGLHHEIVELISGNFLVASHSPPGAPYEDVVVEVGRSSGAIVKSWDFNTILDPKRKSLPDTQLGDWLHINSLYYDDRDNSIVISGRSQCAVVKIDYSTAKVKWILGNHNGWNPSLASFLLTPIDSQGKELETANSDFWNYGQHALNLLPNGNLMLYDNGDYRGFYDNANVNQESYTRAAEYKIDELHKTVELVWTFSNNKTVFTKYTGYVQELEDTRLVAYMWATKDTPRILEVDGSNQFTFEATINRGKFSYYRTLKLDVYCGID